MTKKRDHLKQLRDLSNQKLSDMISDSQKSLIVKRQEKLLGKVKNTAELKQLRKELARMKTILDEKIMAELEKNDG